MSEPQEIIIKQQDQIQQNLHQHIVKLWQNSLLHQKYDHQFPNNTQQCDFSCSIFNNGLAQNPNNHQNGQNCHNQDVQTQKQIIEALKQFLFVKFTDYLQTCQQFIGNIQFQFNNNKRRRKISQDFQQIIETLLQSNELLSVDDIKKFKKIMKQTKYLAPILTMLVRKVPQNMVNQIILCFYLILKKLQQCKEQKSQVNIAQTASQGSKQILHIITSNNKINELFFNNYFTECQQSLKCLIENWLQVILNVAFNKNLQQYIQKQRQKICTDQFEHNLHNSFQFDYGQDLDEEEFLGLPRKINNMFQ